jgi:hypothetical protein
VRTLGLEDFDEWMGLAASHGGRLNAVIARLVDVALAAFCDAQATDPSCTTVAGTSLTTALDLIHL